MRRLVPLFLLLPACASTKLVTQDVVAVAKAPAQEWKSVAVAGAAVGAALLVDDEIARVTRNNDSHAVGEFARTIEPFGGGASDKVIAGYLLYGLARDDSRARAIAFDAVIGSFIASKAITPALKQITGRVRPNGDDDQSFPSNHATQAFAVASVIAAHDERRWVRWLAYGIAGGVGFARVYHDAHHPSDVLAGAAIGTFVGRTVANTNRRERARWTIAPVLDGDRRGLLLTRTR